MEMADDPKYGIDIALQYQEAVEHLHTLRQSRDKQTDG